jgi:hypothetical protein
MASRETDVGSSGASYVLLGENWAVVFISKLGLATDPEKRGPRNWYRQVGRSMLIPASVESRATRKERQGPRNVEPIVSLRQGCVGIGNPPEESIRLD